MNKVLKYDASVGRVVIFEDGSVGDAPYDDPETYRGDVHFSSDWRLLRITNTLSGTLNFDFTNTTQKFTIGQHGYTHPVFCFAEFKQAYHVFKGSGTVPYLDRSAYMTHQYSVYFWVPVCGVGTIGLYKPYDETLYGNTYNSLDSYFRCEQHRLAPLANGYWGPKTGNNTTTWHDSNRLYDLDENPPRAKYRHVRVRISADSTNVYVEMEHKNEYPISGVHQFEYRIHVTDMWE